MIPSRDELEKIVGVVTDEARSYLAGVDERPLRSADADERADAFSGALPDEGVGGLSAVRELIDEGLRASVASSGPRFFHYVIGGVTPAALGAAWLTDAIDQNAALWDASPMGNALGRVSVAWLQDLFGLPSTWAGTIVTGGTMANYTGLAAARRWWGLEHGVDVERQGLSDLPPVPIFSSGYVHASATKVMGMLGMGRDRLTIVARDGVGRIDLDGLRRGLAEARGPAIVIANAGEVNAGDFDPIADIVDVTHEHGGWVHVDGAFGLFAAISPRTRHLVDGVERADSVSVDGHKWLNVPYDTGFTFVRDAELLEGAFTQQAAYLTTGAGRSNLMARTPESSQRSRGIAAWATLRAYGRDGYRRMVEGHLDLAQRLADAVDEAEDLERLAEVPLNIVCFRYHPAGVDDEEKLGELNRRIGQEILRDGRVYVGTTSYDGKTAFRPAIVNWRTRNEDVDLIAETVRDLGSRLA